MTAARTTLTVFRPESDKYEIRIPKLIEEAKQRGLRLVQIEVVPSDVKRPWYTRLAVALVTFGYRTARVHRKQHFMPFPETHQVWKSIVKAKPRGYGLYVLELAGQNVLCIEIPKDEMP